jgi:hypothetical protein
MKTIKYTVILVAVMLFFRMLNGILPAPAPREPQPESVVTMVATPITKDNTTRSVQLICATTTPGKIECHTVVTYPNNNALHSPGEHACKPRRLIGGLICAFARAEQPVTAASDADVTSGNWWENVLTQGISWLCAFGLVAAIVANILSYISRGRAFIRRTFWGIDDDPQRPDTPASSD